MVPYCVYTADLRRIRASCQRDVPKSYFIAAAIMPSAGIHSDLRLFVCLNAHRMRAHVRATSKIREEYNESA
jgi:hypothetical protein